MAVIEQDEKKISVVKIILGTLFCFALLSAVIFSNVQQLQVASEIAKKQQEYVDLQSENVRMKSDLAGRTSNKNVQEYAENVLGMNPLKSSQVEYMQIQKDDVVEIAEEDQNLFVKIRVWFENFVAYLQG
ncbi:MAG: hypothetical protein K2H29_05900 [Oscillospiraceae bacterium]|nr:hypothetical protein [Oscillospiraceae bacterium]MDE5884594.1 hypothetical protein [Oscillospiraceae bacterium]